MSDTLEEQFEAAAQTARTDPSLSNLPNDTKLQIYALFKQATDGDVQGDRPGMFSPAARAKYDAYVEKKGMSKEEAMKEYVDLIQSLKS